MKKIYSLSIYFLLSILIGCEDQEAIDTLVTDVTSPPVCTNTDVLDSNVIIDELEWIPHDQNNDITQSSNAKSIGHLRIPQIYASCTAFLINKDTIMTNNHCISSDAQAKGATFRPISEDNTRDSFLCEKVLVANYLLDFSLIKCVGNPGETYGYLPMSQRKIAVDESIYVIQENCNYLDDPRCLIDKFFAFGVTNKSISNIIGHDADTLPGSSGSPIFAEDTNELIGIHNAGQGETTQGPASNFGVPMVKIKEYLKANHPEIVIYDYLGEPVPAPTPAPVPDTGECIIN